MLVESLDRPSTSPQPDEQTRQQLKSEDEVPTLDLPR